MTIKETVKKALTTLAGNKPIDLESLSTLIDAETLLHVDYHLPFVVVSPNQMRRALRDLPHVRKVNGHYIVKGRRVPTAQPTQPAIVGIEESDLFTVDHYERLANELDDQLYHPDAYPPEYLATHPMKGIDITQQKIH